MKIAQKILSVGVGLFLMWAIWQPLANAQALPAKPVIIFDSFNGTYHLSRDANGRSLLTSEEVILAEFPGNGNFSGITRSIPKSYQGHSVDVKILNVTDAAGSSVPYKTSSDSNNNLVVTTGDPGITIYGSQTFRISYQTSGVIDIKPGNNTFLLDINGRGWDQTINQVSGVVFMPTSFATSLYSKPICYIGYLNTATSNCSISNQVQNGQIVVISKANGPLAPNHALVIKLNFKAATFTNNKTGWSLHRLLLVGATSIIVILVSYWCARRLKQRWG